MLLLYADKKDIIASIFPFQTIIKTGSHVPFETGLSREPSNATLFVPFVFGVRVRNFVIKKEENVNQVSQNETLLFPDVIMKTVFTVQYFKIVVSV